MSTAPEQHARCGHLDDHRGEKDCVLSLSSALGALVSQPRLSGQVLWPAGNHCPQSKGKIFINHWKSCIINSFHDECSQEIMIVHVRSSLTTPTALQTNINIIYREILLIMDQINTVNYVDYWGREFSFQYHVNVHGRFNT